MAFKQSQPGVKFLALLEDSDGVFDAQPYLDIAGIPTVGYGSTHYEDGTPVHITDAPITQQRGLVMLQKDCLKCELALNRLISGTVSLTQNQVDALIAFMYNVGINGFATSTILKTINTSPNKAAGVSEDMFARWDKVHDPKTGELVDSRGLLNRRKAEYALFHKP